MRASLPALLVLSMAPVVHAARGLEVALSRRELDSVGHIWTVWNASLGDPTRTRMAAFPDPVDLLPILGGWLDIFVGGALARLGATPVTAFNGALLLYVWLAGVGLYALARVAGAPRWAAVVAGVLAQSDPFLLHHMVGGRSEQMASGLVALALAGAWASWRGGGARIAVLCGLAGATVIYASWEYGFWLALAMVWLAPFAWWSGRAPGSLRRWGLAAFTCAVTAGPFALLFLGRTTQVRELTEGQTLMDWALPHSVALFGWFGATEIRSSIWVLAPLLLLPWTLPREHRRMGIGVALGLVLTLVMALGPSPGVWEVGDLGLGWSPYQTFQSLPVLGWFHTPERLLLGWFLAGPVACALLLARIGSRGRAGLLIGVLAAGGLVASNLHKAHSDDLLRVQRLHIASDPAYDTLRDHPRAGAVLDLPVVPAGIRALRYTELQLVHQRPIPAHATLAHLTSASDQALKERWTLAAWLTDEGLAAGPPDDETLAAEIAALDAAGYGFVIIHIQHIPKQHRASTRARLREHLGRPVASILGRWWCYEIPATTP